MKKSNSFIIVLIILLSITALLLVGILGFSLIRGSGGITFSGIGGNQFYDLAVERDYDNALELVSLKSNAGDIYIFNSEDGKAHIKIWADENKIRLNESNNRLEVEANAEGKVKIGSGIYNKRLVKIELYLPQNYNGIINLESDYGNFEIGAFPEAELTVESEYGNIEAREAAEITAECSYGNIELGTLHRYASLEADCGNIEIQKLTLTRDSSIQCDLGNIEIGNAEHIKVDAKTDLGTTEVRPNPANAEITLTVRNDCGNITIE